MLQQLHERIHGWLAWLVVGIIAMTFALFGISYYTNSRSTNIVKAEVNGSPISLKDFNNTYRRLKQNVREIALDTEARLKQQALSQLVYEKVLLQAGTSNGFYISRQQTESEIAAIPELQQDGEFSPQRYQQFLSNNMLSQNSYIDLMTAGMLNRQMHFSFIGTSFVLPNELAQYIELANQKRNYEYIVIEPSAIKLAKPVSQLDEQAYYKANENQFKTSEQVSVDYVMLSMKAEMAEIKISGTEVDTYFKENQASYRTPAKYELAHIFIEAKNAQPGKLEKKTQDKIAEIQQQLKQKSFADVADKYSDDLLSKSGKMPQMTITSLEKPLQEAVVELKPNEISEPVHTSEGIEIVQLQQYIAPKQIPLKEVRDSIVKMLRSELAQKAFQSKAEQLADLSYQNPDSLDSVSQTLKLKVHHSKLASRNSGFVAPLNTSKVIQAAFSDDVLRDGNNSQPIQLDDDAVIVLRVNKHVESSLKPFEQVKSEIYGHLEAKAKQQQAKALATQLNKDLADKKDSQFSLLLKDNKLAWKKVTDALRTDSTDINRFAFEIPEFKVQALAGTLKQMPSGTMVLYKLEKVTPGTNKDVEPEQLDTIKQQLASSFGVQAYELYIQGLRKKAKVDVTH